MIASMKGSKLERLSKEDERNLKIVLDWLSSKLESMAMTAEEIHRENEKFFAEFYRKQKILEQQMYEYRRGNPQAYRS